MSEQANTLILLGIPVGNIDDLTSRVLSALREGQYFAVEDTRRFMNLLDRLGINHKGKTFKSFNDHFDKKHIDHFLDILKGNNLYLVSDAGSPVICDPALPLIQAAHAHGFHVQSFSGVNSVSYALELAGLPCLPYTFHGFFPRENGQRSKLLTSLDRGLHLFFESPQRIKSSLELIRNSMAKSDQLKALKELSKEHQSVYEINNPDDIKQIDERGEFVIAYYRDEKAQALSSAIVEMAEQILQKGARPKLVAKLIAELTGKSSKEVYQNLQNN